MFTAQPGSFTGIVIEAYRTEREVPRPLEVLFYLMKEGYEVESGGPGTYSLRGTGVFTVEPLTNADVEFTVTGTGSATPEAVSASPFQATVTLGTEPAVYFIEASSNPEYDYPVVNTSTGCQSSRNLPSISQIICQVRAFSFQ